MRLLVLAGRAAVLVAEAAQVLVALRDHQAVGTQRLGQLLHQRGLAGAFRPDHRDDTRRHQGWLTCWRQAFQPTTDSTMKIAYSSTVR